MKQISLLLLLILTIATADNRSIKIKQMMQTEQRVALVIGNNSYQTPLSVLHNPINDAKAIKNILENRGFRVIYKENTTKRELRDTLEEFYQKLKRGGVGMLYFSGHGLEVDGQNYLIPIDANIKAKSDTEFETIALNKITKRMQGIENRLNIVVLDACRNDPFAKSMGVGGLAKAEPIGLFVSYATGAGKVASDGRVGENGLFTKYLIEYMQQPLTLQKVFQKTRASVYNASAKAQFPAIYDQTINVNFYFTLPKVEVEKQEKISEEPIRMSDNSVRGFLPKNPDFPHGKGITRKDGKCNKNDNGCLRGLPFPSFNNYTDSGIEEGVKDERRFLVVQNISTNSAKTNFVTALHGEEIYAQAYIHNNGYANTIAHNVKIGMVGFRHIGNGIYESDIGTSISLRQFIFSSNSTPNQISDNALITSRNGRKIKLQFQPQMDTFKTTKGHTLSAHTFFKNGTNIGDIKGGSTSNSFYTQITFLVADAETTHIKAKCSSINSKEYLANETNYSIRNNEAFCEEGTVNDPQQILFPSIGGHVTWKCQEENNDISVSCTATRK